jgi:hypothetical protein
VGLHGNASNCSRLLVLGHGKTRVINMKGLAYLGDRQTEHEHEFEKGVVICKSGLDTRSSMHVSESARVVDSCEGESIHDDNTCRMHMHADPERLEKSH